MKHAFRSIPLNIDTKSYSVTWSLKGVTLNAFAELWKKEFSDTDVNNYFLMNDEIAKLYGDTLFEKSCWTAICNINIQYENLDRDLENFNIGCEKKHIIPQILDVVFHIFAGYKKFERFDAYTITSCQEMIKEEKIVVRGSALNGIKIDSPKAFGIPSSLYPQLKLP